MSKNQRNITRHVEVELHASADELADVFWAMDAEEQAYFFNRLGEISDCRLPFQLQSVTDHPYLDANGRRAMELIGGYSKPSGATP